MLIHLLQWGHFLLVQPAYIKLKKKSRDGEWYSNLSERRLYALGRKRVLNRTRKCFLNVHEVNAPFTIAMFPNTVLDMHYCWHVVKPVVSHISARKFISTWRELADSKKIHEGSYEI